MVTTYNVADALQLLSLSRSGRRQLCRWPAAGPGNIRPMNDVERLEAFAVMSGLAPQSIDALRTDFPRMAR